MLAGTRSVAMSFVKLEGGYKMFGLKAPADIANEVHKTVAVARRSMVEYMFVQALLLHETHPDVAVEELKKQSKSLSGASVKLTSQDIHPCIWGCAQKVLSGQPFQRVSPV